MTRIANGHEGGSSHKELPTIAKALGRIVNLLKHEHVATPIGQPEPTETKGVVDAQIEFIHDICRVCQGRARWLTDHYLDMLPIEIGRSELRDTTNKEVTDEEIEIIFRLIIQRSIDKLLQIVNDEVGRFAKKDANNSNISTPFAGEGLALSMEDEAKVITSYRSLPHNSRPRFYSNSDRPMIILPFKHFEEIFSEELSKHSENLAQLISLETLETDERSDNPVFSLTFRMPAVGLPTEER